jgi:hypothetical protein
LATSHGNDPAPEVATAWMTTEWATRKVNGTLRRHGLDEGSMWFHVRSHRVPWNASHLAEHIKTLVMPVATTLDAMEDAARVLRDVPGVIECNSVGERAISGGLRPQVHVYWDLMVPR